MLVLMIIADGNAGGGTTAVLALASDLLAGGVDVSICTQTGSYALAEAKRIGVNAAVGFDFFRRRIDSQLVKEIRLKVEVLSPDIVHVHGGRAAFNWIRVADTRRLERTIYTVHGYHFRRKPQPLRLFAEIAEKRISRSVFRTIFVSQSDQNDAIARSIVSDRRACCVIRNGIRLEAIPPRPNTAHAANRKQVAILGRLTAPKNPNLVLDIAKQMANDGFIFHFIGGGELECAVRQRMKKESISNVILHGNHSHDAALNLMSRFGTFLLASLWEWLQIPPMEAMAMGLAVVTTDVNGCTEVVRDGIDGRVAGSGNRNAFVTALTNVVAEPELTGEMIETAKRRVAEEFTTERVVREHLQLYQECVDR